MNTTLNILPPLITAAALKLIHDADPAPSSPRFIPHEVVLGLLVLQARLGIPWRFMLCKSTLLARRARWIELGVFDRLMELMLVEPDEVSYVDCTFIECKQPHPDRGWTKIGNGLKIQAICRDDGRLVAVRVTCAGPGEARLLQAFLDENPGLDIEWIVGDSAYDTRPAREHAEARGAHLITSNDWPSRKRSMIPTSVAPRSASAGSSSESSAA
jgi:Transposase DDE domain